MGTQHPTFTVQLTLTQGVQTYEINKSEFIFGRSGKADVKIDDAGISREHLKIKFEKDAIHILDLNSLNGAYINGQKVVPMEYIAVPEKAVISFGKCPITMSLSASVPAAEDARTVVYKAEKKAEPPKAEPAQAEEFEIITYDPADDFKKEQKARLESKNENPGSQETLITPEMAEKKSKGEKSAPPQAPVVKQNVSGAVSSTDPILPANVPVNEPVQASENTDIQENRAPSLTEVDENRNQDEGRSRQAPKSRADARKEKLYKGKPGGSPAPIENPKDKADFHKLIDLSAFPKTQEDYRLSFKNVGLDLPRYKNPGEHAKEIITEAEFQKQAIIKSAEVFRSKTINETRIQSKKAADESYSEFKRLVDEILENTRVELKKLRTDTEILLDEKRIQANEEIQRLWEEHEEQIRADKQKQYEAFEKDNKIKLDLSIEKARSDMFAERHKLVTDAENEILQKKRAYQVEFENEKSEHLQKIKTYNEELNKIQANLDENRRAVKEAKATREQAELELSKVMSHLKSEKENLQIINTTFKETEENHKRIEAELANFTETKQKALAEIEKAQADIAKLNQIYGNLSEKKLSIEREIDNLSEYLKDQKAKAKAEVENEYSNLRQTEAQKFEDFKVNELRELKKIRDAHGESIKNFSVDLSQEIATKLELLASKSGYAKFDFDKHFELINSVIQVKAAINTGSESQHAVQLDNWKNRKRKENFSLMARGFVTGLACVFALNFAYKKLGTDPVKAELARIEAENKARDLENKFIPTKTDKYYDTYVDATLYTERFTDVYLDKNNQQEWVNYATKYFLRQWKLEEEKVIEVISNSNALVQNFNETVPTLKKSKLKADLAKMKELEDQYVQNQAKILGSNVKYEAYKKIEKDFFMSKIQGRAPASQE